MIVGEEKAAELLPLEEVLAVVFGLSHRQNVLMRVRIVNSWRIELQPYAWRTSCRQTMSITLAAHLLLGSGRVQRLALQTAAEVAHLLNSNVLLVLGPIRILSVLLIHLASTFNRGDVQAELFL